MNGISAVGQVDDPDIHAVVILVFYDPCDGCDDLGNVNGTILVGDLDIDDAAVGGHTKEAFGFAFHDLITINIRTAAGDDASHVGAVTKCIEIAKIVGL